MTSPMTRWDYLLLAAYCLLIGGFALWFDRTLTSHETVGCVNIREMRADHDWVIPHYGGRPWLERPPLPFWLTLPCVAVLGDVPQAYRLAPLLVAALCVVLVGWMAGLWYGRGVGLLAGLILATTREFTRYASGPESDMFLCGVVTTALALFVHLEYRRRPADGETGFLWGRRPWALLAFFVVLGLANLTKGLFFGDLFILLPIASFLLLGSDRWAVVRRYVWLPGWIAFTVVASAWALAAYWRYPDILDLWHHDYFGRVNQGYMREPAWYYLAQLPWILFPWSLAVVVGLGATWERSVGQGRTPERFLWCWALVPIAFFSIPQGKHHHYLLQALAPWAVLSALGMVRLWQWLPATTILYRPWPLFATVAVPGEIALFLARAHLGQVATPALILWPAIVLAVWWSLTRQELRMAAIALFAVLVPLHWFGHALLTLVDDRYAADRTFVGRIRAVVPEKAALYVHDGMAPLGASWYLFYLQGRADLLHNASFLLREDVEDEVYVLTRRYTVPHFHYFATTELLFESARTQDEGREDWRRYGLYRVRLRPGLGRHRGPVYLSPMQATGRALGPDLVPTPTAIAGPSGTTPTSSPG